MDLRRDGGGILDEVGLGEQHQRLDLAARRDGQEARQAARVEVAIRRRGEQREVDVGGQHLGPAAVAATGDHAAPRQHGPHRAVRQRADEVAGGRHGPQAPGQRRAP
jgi:hypothetical protein